MCEALAPRRFGTSVLLAWHPQIPALTPTSTPSSPQSDASFSMGLPTARGQGQSPLLDLPS